MELFKTLVIVVILLLYNAYCMSSEKYQKWKDCLKQCGDEYDRTLLSGHFQCTTTSPNGNEFFTSPCVNKCMGITPDQDQTKCWCNVCKSSNGLWAPSFCTALGQQSLKEDQCESLVCTGKALFRGKGCGKRKS